MKERKEGKGKKNREKDKGRSKKNSWCSREGSRSGVRRHWVQVLALIPTSSVILGKSFSFAQ